MKFTLTPDLFTNGSYVVTQGLKQATFTIVDEEFTGAGGMPVKIDRMICVVRTNDADGNKESEVFGALTIGLGDSNIAVTTDDITLRGKQMTQHNMEQCMVEFYE